MYSPSLEKSELAISTVMKKEESPVELGREEKTTSHVGGDDSNDAQTIVDIADSWVPCAAAHPLCCAPALYGNNKNSTSANNTVCSQHLAMPFLLRLKNVAKEKHSDMKERRMQRGLSPDLVSRRQEADVANEKIILQCENV